MHSSHISVHKQPSGFVIVSGLARREAPHFSDVIKYARLMRVTDITADGSLSSKQKKGLKNLFNAKRAFTHPSEEDIMRSDKRKGFARMRGGMFYTVGVKFSAECGLCFSVACSARHDGVRIYDLRGLNSLINNMGKDVELKFDGTPANMQKRISELFEARPAKRGI